MTSRPRRRLFATALAIAALGALIGASAASAVPRSFFGVVPQTALTTADIDRMGQGRVGTLRIILNWSSIEAQPDVYDWSGVDAIVTDAARNGITVLPFLYGTPDWVAREIDGSSCTDKCPLFVPRKPDALRAWRDFVANAVARYKPGGQFFVDNPAVPAVPIRAWQVWNEQNSKSFYRPKPSPKTYAKLLDQAAKAIRRNDPSAEIVLGGMAEFRRLAAGPKVIAGSDFLDRLYKEGGVKKDFDGVAPHPYAGKVARVKRQTEVIRKILRRRRDTGADLWVTEIGWGSSTGNNPLEVGPQDQAKRLKQSFRYFKSRANRLNVKAVTWFSWMDSQSEICEWCANSGLFGQGLVEKPAWRAFVGFTGGS